MTQPPDGLPRPVTVVPPPPPPPALVRPGVPPQRVGEWTLRYGYPTAPAGPTAPDGRPLASFVERLGAYLLDRLIVGGITAVPVVVVALFAFVPPVLHQVRTANAVLEAGGNPPPLDSRALLWPYFWVLATAYAAELVVGYLYEAVYQSRTGQTVGKKVLRIRVVQPDGGPLSRGGATRRFLTQFGCALVPGLAYLDGLWQLWDKPLRQCLHDKAAKTIVVKVWE